MKLPLHPAALAGVRSEINWLHRAVEAHFRQTVAHFAADEMTAFSVPKAATALNPQLPPSQKASSGDHCGTAGA